MGSRNFASAWRDARWGFEHCYDNEKPPTAGAGLWRRFGEVFYDELEMFLNGEYELEDW
jgi:hypothetical protein